MIFFYYLIFHCVVQNLCLLQLFLVCHKDDDNILGTQLSEVEDSGLPRDFSHESCQISGEVVEDTTSVCQNSCQIFLMSIINMDYQYGKGEFMTNSGLKVVK